MDNAAELIRSLPANILAVLERVSSTARARGYQVYLVGGAVRDLLLERATRDIDLAVAGDAIALAKALNNGQSRLTVHAAFGTAKLVWPNFEVDLATVRAESYARPGALPTVHAGALQGDLFRRDFTMNALAVSLNADDYGRLIDCYGGLDDLKNGVVRALHEKSFTDDPTRIWRAARYEQRLGFKIAPDTLKHLKRGLPELENITGDRIWYELECALAEEEPEKVLTRLDGLGALGLLHPSLKADDWLAQRFGRARTLCRPEGPPAALYLALMVYRLSRAESAELEYYLHLNKILSRVLNDTQAIKKSLEELARPGLKPGAVYRLLHGYAPEALTANFIAGDSVEARQYITLYQDKLCGVKTSLTGDDLIELGLPPGPRIREILQELLDARLDGRISSRTEELVLARAIIAGVKGKG